MPPWHEGWSITCTFFSTTDSTANKQQAFLFQSLTPPLRSRNTTGQCEHHQMRNKRLLLNQRTVVSLYSELPPSMIISPASRRGTWEINGSQKQNLFNKEHFQTNWTQLSTKYRPVCQWSRPQPVQPWPAEWSSSVSSTWTPCPPETLLQSPWSP